MGRYDPKDGIGENTFRVRLVGEAFLMAIDDGSNIGASDRVIAESCADFSKAVDSGSCERFPE
jgi:hypothetical protein